MGTRLLLALAAAGAPWSFAWADPLCARFGQPAYTATRVTQIAAAPPGVSQVFVSGQMLRIEAPGPREGRMVTLLTPDLQALFLTTADPPVAIRMPVVRPVALPAEERREREERASGRIALITEMRGASGRWHEIGRVLCRGDGVLLEARQIIAREGGPAMMETRQSEIRLGAPDPALFRLPAGFGLIEPPPRPAR